jgi:deoxyribodipyrimidine photo-lyase
MTRTAVVLLTRDLRVHDHEGLREAARAHDRVVPLFVLDDRLLDPQAANRLAFLTDALADLRDSLRRRGSDLVVRRGDPVTETLRVARVADAATVFTSADSSSYAQSRERGLVCECARAGVELRAVHTTSAIPPGELAPEERDQYRVFTPYWRRWRDTPMRSVEDALKRLPPLVDLEPGELPSLRELTRVPPSRELVGGGETAARRRLDAWLCDGLGRYRESRDRLTSGLSPYLHFGCVSPVEMVARAREHRDANAFVRQLCWRDFFGQLLTANPNMQREDIRARGNSWRDDDQALAAWREGRTGYPIVDAAMRQLAREGWMPNRARLIVGSFLTQRRSPSTSGSAPTSSSSCSSTPTWRTTSATGNGSPALARTRAPIASPIPCVRRSASTPKGTTSAATSPSSRRSRARASTSRGTRTRRSLATTLSASSTTNRPGGSDQPGA